MPNSNRVGTPHLTSSSHFLREIIPKSRLVIRQLILHTSSSNRARCIRLVAKLILRSSRGKAHQGQSHPTAKMLKAVTSNEPVTQLEDPTDEQRRVRRHRRRIGKQRGEPGAKPLEKGQGHQEEEREQSRGRGKQDQINHRAPYLSG